MPVSFALHPAVAFDHSHAAAGVKPTTNPTETNEPPPPPASTRSSTWSWPKVVLAPAVGAVLFGLLAGTGTPAAAMGATSRAGDSRPAAVQIEPGGRAKLARALPGLPSVRAASGEIALPAALVDRTRRAYGAAGVARLERWAAFATSMRAELRANPQAEASVITKVHRYFNRTMHFVADQPAGADYWQSVFETVARGGGDCEDAALAKYATLHLAGISKSRLGIAVGLETWRRAGHAVTVVAPRGRSIPALGNIDGLRQVADANQRLDPLVLDNLAWSPNKLSGSSFELFMVVNERGASSLPAKMQGAFARSRPALR